MGRLVKKSHIAIFVGVTPLMRRHSRLSRMCRQPQKQLRLSVRSPVFLRTPGLRRRYASRYSFRMKAPTEQDPACFMGAF